MAGADVAAGPNGPGLRLLGFPVSVRPGFLVFVAIILLLYSSAGETSYGVWAAVALTVFTLIHELGHAVAARATGAAGAEIALDFLVGYTSYRPTRRLARWERAGIAVAGPAAQLVAAVVALAVVGQTSWAADGIRSSEVGAVIWWFGVALAFVNLLPVVPLDGGTIVSQGLDWLLPGRAARPMMVISLAVTGIALFAVITNDSLRPFTFVVAMLGVMQLRQLNLGRPIHPDSLARDHERANAMIRIAEDQAWTTGAVSPLPPGATLSPWYQADRALAAGDLDGARRLLLDDLTGRTASTWVFPTTAPPARLGPLAALLPDPLPHGRRSSEQALTLVLLMIGETTRAARYASESFTRSPAAWSAVTVARAAAASGDDDLAAQWLHTAAGAGDDPQLVARTIDQGPEMVRLRTRPDVVELRRSLGLPPPAPRPGSLEPS